MLVTLLGMVMDAKDEHSSKAASPMLVTLLGIVMDVREVQKEKALSPRFVMPLCKIMLVIVELSLYQGTLFLSVK